MLACSVESQGSTTDYAEHARHGDQTATDGTINLAEEPNSFTGNVHGAPEVGLKNRAGHLVWRSLYFSQHCEACTIEDDIDATEGLMTLVKGVHNIDSLGNIELQNKQMVGRVLTLEMVEHFRFAQGCNCDVAL